MKNRIRKLITGVLTLGLGAALLTGCSNAHAAAKPDTAQAATPDASNADKVYRTLDEIKADGTINIGVFSDKNPFGYVDENGQYQGYDVYFAERIGKDLGVNINYVSTEAASRVLLC